MYLAGFDISGLHYVSTKYAYLEIYRTRINIRAIEFGTWEFTFCTIFPFGVGIGCSTQKTI